MATLDIVRLNAPAIAAAMNARRVDPGDFADAFLGQAARRNFAVNAVVDRDEVLLGLRW